MTDPATTRLVDVLGADTEDADDSVTRILDAARERDERRRRLAAALVPRLLLDTDRTPAGVLGQAFLGLADGSVASSCSLASWK